MKTNVLIFICAVLFFGVMDTYSHPEEKRITANDFGILQKVEAGYPLSTHENKIFQELTNEKNTYEVLGNDGKDTILITGTGLQKKYKYKKIFTGTATLSTFDESYENHRSFLLYAGYLLPCFKKCLTVE